jgi:hypothetical protein
VKIQIKDLPPLQDGELEIKSKMCIVGYNGVGKSRLLNYIFSKTGKFVILDNVLAGTHHRSLKEKWDQIWMADPSWSYICSSHNPYFVDLLPAECILVMASPDLLNGPTKWKWLSEHPAYVQYARYGIKSGEFWSDVGEKWVLD